MPLLEWCEAVNLPALHNALRLHEDAPVTPGRRLVGHRIFVDVGPTGTQVTVTPVRSATGLSELMEFSITGLGFANDVLDEEGNVIDVKTGGYATEDGPGETARTLRLTLSPWYGNNVSAWLWDATEVESGITFNPHDALRGEGRGAPTR